MSAPRPAHPTAPRPRERAWLAEQIASTPHWRVVAPVALQTVCIRHAPLGLDDPAVDAHNLGIARRDQRQRRGLPEPSVARHQILRVSVGAELTERRHVERCGPCSSAPGTV